VRQGSPASAPWLCIRSKRRYSVLDMTRSTTVAQLSSEFNDFLFAPIAEDRHGMPLSVLSALARLNVDPWQEAARLTSLPREAAIQRLTGLIAELPGGSPTHPGPATNAAGLIRLLPHRADRTVAARNGPLAVGLKPNLVAIAYLVWMAFMLGAQLLTASPESSAHVHNPHVPTTGMVSPTPMLPLDTGP